MRPVWYYIIYFGIFRCPITWAAQNHDPKIPHPPIDSRVLFMRLLLTPIFYLVFSVNVAQAATGAMRCADLLAGAGRPTSVAAPKSRVDVVWEAMTGDSKGLTYLLERAVPLSKDMTVQERIEFTERCMVRQEGQSSGMGGAFEDKLQ